MTKELIFSIIKKINFREWIHETTKHDLWISLFLTRPTSRSQVLKSVLLDAFKVVLFWFWLSRDILSQWIFNAGGRPMDSRGNYNINININIQIQAYLFWHRPISKNWTGSDLSHRTIKERWLKMCKNSLIRCSSCIKPQW